MEDGEIMAWVPQRNSEGELYKGEFSTPLDYLMSQLAPWTIEPFVKVKDTGIMLQQGQLLLLAYLFSQYTNNRQVVYKRPATEESEYDLYLLVKFGTEWYGLKTRVVES